MTYILYYFLFFFLLIDNFISSSVICNPQLITFFLVTTVSIFVYFKFCIPNHTGRTSRAPWLFEYLPAFFICLILVFFLAFYFLFPQISYIVWYVVRYVCKVQYGTYGTVHALYFTVRYGMMYGTVPYHTYRRLVRILQNSDAYSINYFQSNKHSVASQ